MHGPALAVALNCLGFHIHGLTNGARPGSVRISFANHMGGQRDGTTVGKRGKPWILRGSPANLNEKCTEQKPCGEREGFGQPRSPREKPHGSESENGNRNRPPRRRPPRSQTHPKPERKHHGRPKHRLPWRLQFMSHGSTGIGFLVCSG